MTYQGWGFENAVCAKFLGDGEWKLTAPLKYRAVGGRQFEVPTEDFTTDFASTPRFLWPFFPPAGKYLAAAILHDYLYRAGVVSRVVADAIFLEAMASLGVWRPKRYVIYLAVRAFGGSSYKPAA